LTFFGLSDKGHPGYEEIKAKLFVKTSASEKQVEEAWKETLARSPVGNTLTRNVKITPQISVAK
ncbi:MAG: OsmC family protein, partial [Nitrososphaerota archaeon]|nr:OsmC family protein [Nitrososphaerota archaeon]